MQIEKKFTQNGGIIKFERAPAMIKEREYDFDNT